MPLRPLRGPRPRAPKGGTSFPPPFSRPPAPQVSEHSGGLGGGHYTATALDDATQVWYHYNDSLVSRADPNNVVSSQAYVLFYKRKASPRA